jgi:AraC family transcriptional regulator, regulatory protein of adaptative response / DNA-3-methyladenine glycosylase II
VTSESYARTLSLPHGEATVRLTFPTDHVLCSLRLADMRDLGAAVSRVRRLLDLDADPVAVDSFLGADPVIGPLVRSTPGIRVAGSVDGTETLLRLVAPYSGVPLQIPDGTLTHLYSAGDHPVTEAVATGRLVVDVGRSFEDLTEELAPLVGARVADEVAMRVLGAPDVLVLPRTMQHLASHGTDWRPWRSYAGAHLTRKAATS